MRKIKFRAWDKETKEIRDVMGFDYESNTIEICSVPTRKFNDGVLHTIHALSRDMNSVILLQYTGLKDMNGVEIYEGDIVQINDRPYLVEWKVGKFILRLKGHVINFTFFEPRKGENVYEVIGNFHENKELIQ